MEWLVAILTITITPLTTMIGSIIVEKFRLKGKKIDNESANNVALAKCRESHKSDIESVKSEFKDTLDEMKESINAVLNQQLKMKFTIEALQKDVQKHNNVVERTYGLEENYAVLNNKVETLEKKVL